MHWLDPDYLPVTTGVVERFTINLDGDVDGFLLTDQTLIHTPPHLSDQLKAAIGPGDSIHVRGVKPRYADLIAAVAIEKAGGAIVIDDGPEEKETDDAEKPRTQRASMEASGIVRLTLFAPKGQARGALLHDGTILRLGHKEARRHSDRFRPGTQICIRGEGLVNEQGRVIEVREIGKPDGSFEPIKRPKHEEAKAAEPDAIQTVA
ncbi:hypothetical protein AS156_38580 [Bradyrhizobium macuxiense]|uniref:Uncharacterized protein n=1 Tax=Bradyrhizobium macuxiense TaxID=1755647 RepID=A0A120FPX4_9BRAD|nr:hypothetical protein [Bradyrhizobium macuxiense]KWV57622.1 hypothetical protein AS156_38580 [Bradyrhizobium macuxiense]